MGTTTNLDYPYPEPTDRVRNGSTAIRGLAEAVDAGWPTEGAVIGQGDSPTVGPADITFPGAVTLLAGFTFDGISLTRVGPSSRLFVVYVEAGLTSSSPGASALTTSLRVLLNGAIVAETFDRVATTTGVLDSREFAHSVTVPVIMAAGDTIVVRANQGTVGSCALRAYPIGPIGAVS